MCAAARLGGLASLVAVMLAVWWLGPGSEDAVTIGPHAEVTNATQEQIGSARWAIGRFTAAGLRPPAITIEFHLDRSGCDGHFGLARAGRVGVCTIAVNAMTRRILLHEMSHIWIDQHVGADTRERFLDLRGLPSWNSREDAWRLRGYEQGAEVISWALGERILTPQIPEADPEGLATAYEVLTGSRFPSAVAGPGL